jgi:hypothetical protein
MNKMNSTTDFSLATRVASLILSAVLLMPAAMPAAASSGTEGAAFLDIPVGAGPAALGSAYTALATDAYAPTWNPAGLGFLESTSFSGQHLSYLESIHYEYLSAVHPLPQSRNSDNHSAIGFSAQYLASGDIAGTNELGDSIGDFSSHYGSYNLAYGRTFGERLSLGLTGKWINAKIDDVSANAYAMDLGSMYRMNSKLTLAGTLVNFGTKLKFIEEGDSLPMAIRLGAAYELNKHWMMTSEGVYRKNGLASFHAGTAWRPMEAISLRVGYKTDTLKGLSALAGFNTGIGIHVWGQEFAYAWAPYGELGNAQYFSLLVRFGSREEAKRNLIQYQTIKKHRSVRGTEKQREVSEPEYQQLMQLLANDDSHVAQAGSGEGSLAR